MSLFGLKICLNYVHLRLKIKLKLCIFCEREHSNSFVTKANRAVPFITKTKDEGKLYDKVYPRVCKSESKSLSIEILV